MKVVKKMGLINPVNILVKDEYERAAGIWGEVFTDAHQGYGVIAEEIQEAGDELEKVEGVMYQLLAAIRDSKGKAISDLADYMQEKAVNAAAECIQVAAMCHKMRRTVCHETAV